MAAAALRSIRLGRIELQAGEGVLQVEVEGERRDLPGNVLSVLFARYGRPLAEGVDGPAEWLSLGDGVRVGVIRHRSPVDVIANDYVVLAREGDERASVVAAPLVTAALVSLCRGGSGG